MIRNVTPHPVNIYPPDCPDRVDPDKIRPVHTFKPWPHLGTPRIAETSLGTVYMDTGELYLPIVPVEYVQYDGLVDPLPEEIRDDRGRPKYWYIVPLVVALQQQLYSKRADLLVPYREVRNPTGTVIGCRQLARPV